VIGYSVASSKVKPAKYEESRDDDRHVSWRVDADQRYCSHERCAQQNGSDGVP
jgi:hypothetical protein